MKYAARLVSRENEVIREFRFRSVDITTIKKWHYKKRQDDEARDDIKHDMHSSSRSRNKDPNTKLNKRSREEERERRPAEICNLSPALDNLRLGSNDMKMEMMK